MTSLPEDGERRPMSLRQDSDGPPQAAGCQIGPPALPAAQQDVSQRHYLSIYNGPSRGVRIQDADVMPLCVLAS